MITNIKLIFTKSITKQYLVFTLLLLNICHLNAQKFERISNKEGFNQNTINDIEQDQYGFLWYGTPNGLIRYDGYEFKTYTTQSKTNGTVSSNYIHSLHNDKNGNLWIGTNLGVDVYVPSFEKFYTIPLPEKFVVTKITSDLEGNIWFSGKESIYVCSLLDIDNGVFDVSENIVGSKLKGAEIFDFSFEDKKHLILATNLGLKKVLLTNNPLKKSFKIDSILDFKTFNHKIINTIFKAKDYYWLGTNEGLLKVVLDESNAYVIKNFNLAKNETPSIINTILDDSYGSVWIGTLNNGLFKYNKKEDTFDNFEFDTKNEHGLSSNRINTLYQDNFNVLWIGTAQGGINKLDISQKKFINYSNNPYNKESIADNLITSILEDRKGRLWLSGYNKPLMRSKKPVNVKTVDNLTFQSLENKISINKNDVIRCIYEDKKGYIWIGSDLGIIVYNPFKDAFKKLALKHQNGFFISNITIAISETDSNDIILAGNKVLVIDNPYQKIENNKSPVLHIKSVLNFNSSKVQTILKDGSNVFWLGTDNGLLKTTYNGTEIIVDEKYTDSNPKIKLSYNNIFSLNKKDNVIWIGTFGGGLNKMTLDANEVPTKVEYFRKKNILPDDAIYGILQDKDTSLWLSTDMGLVKFKTKNSVVNVYDVRDGLTQNNFRQGAHFKGASGYFYFGGLNGLTVFKPSEIHLNTQAPEVLISGLLINNKTVKIGQKFNNKIVLEKSIAAINKLSINQDAQIISFNVVAEHTSTPSKNKLSYILKGFNDSWIETESGKTTITYTNLSAGNYVLKIRASNGDGVWSESKNIEIEITPPWYQTWWSYLLFSITILAIIFGVILYSIRHEKLKQRLKYEEIDKERIEIVNQGKFRYFTNLSHEFRTPLTLIAGPLERIISQNSNDSNTKYLAIIQKNTKRLLSLVDQLITFRQAEQGYIDLNLIAYTLGDFIYPITEAFENYALEKNINFFYKVSEPNEEIIIDVEKVERIIFNLLSNAFKNTPTQGNISIEAGIKFVSGVKMIQIDVVDSGKGIPKENLKNIFERFYQLGNIEGEVSGGGIGLAFCKSLVDILQGEISAKSIPDKETRFSIVIPSKEIKGFSVETSEESKKSFIKNWVPLTNEITQKAEILSESNNKKEYSILIVENEVDVQHFLMSTLSEKYNITIANNGIEGLSKIALKEPDLIISDVMMPEMDGYELCKRIKSDAKNCHIPILLLTALGANEDIIKGLEFGADEYLSKPFSIKHLELRIEKLIKSSVQIKQYFAKNSDLPKEESNLELSTKDKEFIKSIIDTIEKNLSNSNFGVEELSKEIGLSTSHFYRKLKQLTGQVPNVYIRNFRLQRAAELLKSNEGFNVAEVMYQIGIESNSYFSTSFKKLHGVSPSEFLKKN